MPRRSHVLIVITLALFVVVAITFNASWGGSGFGLFGAKAAENSHEVALETTVTEESSTITLPTDDSSEQSVTAALNVVSPLTCPGPVTWSEQAHPTVSDTPTAGDYFGYGVALSGDTAVVGAVFDDDGGTDAGSAYVFTRSGTVWTLQQKLLASDGAAGDNFGVSVAISGDTIVVGAFLEDHVGSGNDAGAAYVFTRSGTMWTQQAKLTALDGADSDNFGVDVDVSGDTAIVGAHRDDISAAPADLNAGSAYVFTRSGTVWSQQQKLMGLDTVGDDQFGFSVAVEGDTAAVGARLDDNPGVNSGSAYVFTRSGTVWSQQAKLNDSDTAAGDNLGYNIALSGDTIVVAATGDDTIAGTEVGSAVVFTRSGVVWSQQQKLTASDGATDDFYGTALAIQDDTIIVGSIADDTIGVGTNAGSAYVYRRCTGIWAEDRKLFASDGASADEFGRSAAIDGDTVIVSAGLDDTAAGTDAGSIYVITSAASCPMTVLPNNNSSSASARAPYTRARYARAVYLITAAELAAAGYTSGSIPTTIGWNYQIGELGGAAPLVVYLQNTSDTTNTKSTAWSTAISGMIVVHSATTAVPATAGPFDIALTGGSSFTYTGGGLYVAFDWGQYTGTLSTTNTIWCTNTLTSGLLGAQSDASAPTTLTASNFRPETRLNGAASPNDAAVTEVYSYGELPLGAVPAQNIKAVITNNSGVPLINLPVTLNVTGADTFSDVQVVPKIASCGGKATVIFASFTPGSLGSDTITVSIPADDVGANNSKSKPLNITSFDYSYKYPGSTSSGGVGFTGGTGAALAKFTTTTALPISAVKLEFFAIPGTQFKVVIYGDSPTTPGTPGAQLYAGSTQGVAAPGPISTPVGSVAVGPGDFYVGIQQTNTTNANLSFDSESPLRTGAFFSGSGNPPVAWGDLAATNLTFKMNVGLTFGAPTPTSTSTNTPTATNTSTATSTATFTPTPVALNAITTYDAALVPTNNTSGGNLEAAADVTGNCALNGNDIQTIMNYVVNNGANYFTTGSIITPPGPCANYPTTVNILKGDVTAFYPTPQPGATTVAVSLPAVTATPGEILIPITVGPVTALSYELQVSFDPSVITPASTPFDAAGTMSSTSNITLIVPNANDPGHLIISALCPNVVAPCSGVSGQGTLLNLRFNVVGTPGQSTALTFENYTDSTGTGNHIHQSFLFDEGHFLAVTTNGSVTIAAATPTATNTPTPAETPSIGGTVTYGNSNAGTKFISNAAVNGAGSPNVFTTTAAPGGTAGQYLLTGFGAGSYTVSLSKTTGQNSITSNDAARIAQHVSGSNLLNTTQKVVADVSNNGVVSSFDAGQIATFVATGSSPGIAGQWRFFVPPGPTFPVGSSPTSRTYSSVTSNITGDDYVGLLIGEVTGNWTPSAARPAGRVESGKWKVESEDGGPVKGIAVELPNMVTEANKEVLIPITIQGAADKEIISYEFNLRYDPSAIQPVGDVVLVKDSVSRGLSYVVNAEKPGILRVVFYGPLPISNDGVLLNLRFTAVGAVGSVSPISFERIMFNEGEPRVAVADGKIELF